MTWLLSQTPELTEAMKGVQRHFERGGAVGSAVAIILSLFALVLLVHLLTRRDRSAQAGGKRSDPQRLFRDMLAGLQLTPQQGKSLMTISKELGLAHPSVLLLSRTVFDRHVKTWQTKPRSSSQAGHAPTHKEHFAEVRAVLFPKA